MWIDLYGDPIVIDGLDVLGYYAHLEWDANTRSTELRLLCDLGPTMPPLAVPLHLVPGGTIADCAARTELHARANMLASGSSDLAARATLQGAAEAFARFEPLVSLVLYLCSQAPDLTSKGLEATPRRPSLHALKAAGDVTPWDVGARLGAALRWAEQHAGSEPSDDTHASPRAHVRRAHWHTYWVGSEARKDRRRELRWLAPMLVAAELPDELAAVVRRVRE